IDPGEEVLLPDPIWFHYATLVEMAGGVPRPVRTDVRDGFLLHGSELEKVASPKSRLLILNNPSNPTGRVLSRKELDDVAAVSERLDLTILSDEIYEKIVYPPFVHQSLATLPGMRERTIVTNGFSKGYALMGWRVGYAAAPREMMRKLDPLLGYMLVCASSMGQHAALEALQNPMSKEYTRKMLDAWERRRAIVMRYVSENPEILSARSPEGTFYAWLDLSGSGYDSKAGARAVLEQANVGVMPGYLFGNSGRNHVRVSFATSDSVVDEGMHRMCTMLSKARREKQLVAS
ncbi:MAG: pyridoxal phosphate-dependent aminotransferase, partial [Nitrososphaerales archaeon]